MVDIYPTLTSNSPTTHIFAPSYRIITDLTKTSGIHFFCTNRPVKHFPGMLSKPVCRSLQSIQHFIFSIILILQSSQDNHVNYSVLGHKTNFHFLIISYFIMSSFNHLFHHLLSCLSTAVHEVTSIHTTSSPSVWNCQTQLHHHWNHYYILTINKCLICV